MSGLHYLGLVELGEHIRKRELSALEGGKTKAGLPVGFQLVGRHLDETAILRAGHAFQRETDWHRRRPPL